MEAGQGPPVSRNGLLLEVPDGTVELEPPVRDDFTVSFRFRTDAPARPDRDQTWWTGQGLVSGEVPGIVHDWGLSMQDDGRISAGTGNPELSINSTPGFNDGREHHVAFKGHEEEEAYATLASMKKVGTIHTLSADLPWGAPSSR